LVVKKGGWVSTGSMLDSAFFNEAARDDIESQQGYLFVFIFSYSMI